MKINFIKSNNSAIKSSSDNFEVVILTIEDLKKNNSPEIKQAKDSSNFEGKFGQSKILSKQGGLVLLIGIGEERKINDLILQKIGGKIASMLDSIKAKNAKIIFSQNNSKNIANIAFGSLLQGYRFNKYFENRKKEKQLKIESISLICNDEKSAEKEFLKLEILAKNIFFVRDLVSEPSNILNPESYAEICKTLKKDGLQVEVFGESEMQKLGMNALLGVGRGSEKESHMVILKWNGGKKGEQPLAFIGKGVTFDTGGISLKPANNMEDMKTDMAGSAVVVGLMRNLAQRKAKVNAIGAIGLVENMPSGTAQRPGDVVRSMSGQTIEVINTDAEGRLVLADVLHYVNSKYKPKFMIDLATLTGAIIISLADVYAGLFCNDDDLAKAIKISGDKTGDRVWQMPIGEEYDDMINSDIADMKNVGSGRGAGSITAAQFLKRFVGQTKWAHLDIAGVAWKGKGDAMAHKGATGFGIRLLDDLVKNYEK